MKLNLGCGKNYIDGWVNVDFYDDSYCDKLHDLEVFPWPWEDNSISEIQIFHTLEHLGADWRVYIQILQEMYRICEDDAKIEEVWKSAYPLSEFTASTNFKSYEELKTRLDAVLSGSVTVGNVAEEIEDAPIAAPVVDTAPVESTSTKEEDDDTMDYFQKLANG